MAKGHYIPQTYFRRFIDKSLYSERTWQIVKTSNCKIIHVPISNIGQKPNLFISKAFDNKKDNEFIEKVVYSEKIEPDYNNAYKILTNPDKIEISQDERELILISLLSMYYRHYDHLELKNATDKSEINYISEYLKAKGKNTKYEKGNLSLDFNNPSEILNIVKDVNKENFILDHLGKTLELIKQRVNDSICVIKLNNRYPLISSDRPFYFNNYFGFLSFCLPIDKEHLVLISPVQNENKIIRIEYSDEDLNMVISSINNEMEYRLSKNIAISEDENILKNFLTTRKEFGFDLIENKDIDFQTILNDKDKFGY